MDCQTRMLINGRWVAGTKADARTIVNPATEEPVAEVTYGSAADAHAAVDAAVAAGPAWAAMTAYQRWEILRRAADLIRQRVETIARLLTMEQGKPLPEARGELTVSANWIDWCAEGGKRLYGQIVPASVPNKRLFITHHPVGVCAVISPWNFPVLLAVRNIAAALSAGCTVVSRPASQTPMALLAVFECLHDAGLPAGAGNIVTGRAEDVAEVFLQRREVRKICFTGSTEVGKRLYARGADQVKRMSLELGGSAPFIILPDADMDFAGRLASQSKFRNNGQVCISASRFYVHRDVRRAFEESVTQHTIEMKVGNGLEEGVQIGPMFERKALDRASELVADAQACGARTLIGGRRHPGFSKGFFFEPTVVSIADFGLQNADSTTALDAGGPSIPNPQSAIRNQGSRPRLLEDEPFAPILPIMGFETLAEAAAKANSTPYGLAAYIVTNRLDWAVWLAEHLEAGIVGINEFSPATPQCPFGGMKESGLGREGGPDALAPYVETKYVCLTLPNQVTL